VLGYHANRSATGAEHRIGDQAHHSDMTTAKHQPNALSRHKHAQIAAGFGIGRIIAGRGAAEHTQ